MVSSTLFFAALVSTLTAAAPSELSARTTPAPIVDTVSGWQTHGCVVDNPSGALSFELADSPTMTVASCVATCQNAGFILAGLTGGTQCWCGNILKGGSTAATADACAVGCGGDATQSCGGTRGQRMLIYQQTPFLQPAVVSAVGSWASLGCWSDSPQSRALHHDGGGSDGMTVESCLSTCSAAGLPLAGVESGLQCFCGNAMLFNHLQVQTGCDIACAGKPSEMCGGLGALNLYQFNNTPFTFGQAVMPRAVADWTLLGCTAEASSGPRRVPVSQNIPIENMSVETCLDACAAGGFTVGALQFGQECRCGNVDLSTLPAVDNSQCNLACTANANEFCGGPGTNQVYFTS